MDSPNPSENPQVAISTDSLSQLDSFDDPALTEPQQQTETLPELPSDWLKFCESYLQTFNATQSYMAAYPSCTRLSAGSTAFALLKQPRVAEYVRIKKLQADNEFKQQLWKLRPRILQEYQRLAFSRLEDLVSADCNGNPTFKATKDYTEDERGVISEVTIGRDGSVNKFKVHSKTEALRDLSTMAGMLSEEVKTQLNVQINVRHLY